VAPEVSAPAERTEPARPWLSIVGPVHDEQPCLATLYLEIRAAMGALDVAGRSWELILVDDASTDGSLEELLRIGYAVSRWAPCSRLVWPHGWPVTKTCRSQIATNKP
jgi:hypothetical protein